jgi:hypothetical protein
MKPSALCEALHALISQRVPLHIWGACGVGKSQIVAQVATSLNYEFLDILAVQLDPVDLRGLPRITADQAEWVPPKFFPNDGEGILFLDELTSAPQMPQAGCYQLVLDRKLGEYTVPDGWVVIAAGNRASERGVHFSMPRPLRNRFVHLNLEPDFEDWTKWAVKAGIRPEILAFLRFKSALLHDPDATADQNAWPTPRSWEMASQVLTGVAKRQGSSGFCGGNGNRSRVARRYDRLGGDDRVCSLRAAVPAAAVGAGDPAQPGQSARSREPSARIAVATALGRVLTDHSIAKGMMYLNRLPTEMRVLSMRDAAVRDRAITHTPEFVQFGIEHAEVLQ